MTENYGRDSDSVRINEVEYMTLASDIFVAMRLEGT
jgi:hypothetical protein